MKYKVQVFNTIADKGLVQFDDNYQVSDKVENPDLIVLRSHKLHDYNFADTVKAVGRAGVGVNNIPVAKLTEQGIPVFNTPGANANAVKELVIAGMLLGCRNICQGWQYSHGLQGSEEEIHQLTEKGKKQFAGFEIKGKTLGVIGLGAIGVAVANTAMGLGMNVIGYDPVISVEQAWKLEAAVARAKTLEQLITQADFITVHVPLNDATRHMLNTDRIKQMKKGVVVLNFAREEIVNNEAILQALQQEAVRAYVSDFPAKQLIDHPRVIHLPHLGASTEESEENCAVMVVQQLKHYIETGNITNSVNFPSVDMPWGEGNRIAIVNRNIPNMVSQISTAIGSHDINVIDLINRSKDEIAYTMLDIDGTISDQMLAELQAIDGVVTVRKVRG